MITLRHYFVIFLIALAVTAALVPVVRRIAIHFDVVDKPGPRRVNKVPIPRMGGLAMFLGMVVALGAEFACEYVGFLDGPFLVGTRLNIQLFGVMGGLMLIVIVGLVDDVHSLRPVVKLLGQVAAACLIVFTGTLLHNFKLPFSNIVINLGDFAYIITVLYLVAFANIINLIDGLDGLAAGISGIAALSLFALMYNLGRIDAALLAIVLVGVCIGFLFYNFNPASIFMGDSGSLLLGMTLGTVSLLGAARFASVTALAVPIVIAGIPVIDTFSAIVRRLRGHQSIMTADAGHIHHRLLRRGFSQRKAVLIIYAWTALLCAGATVIWQFGGVLKYTVLIIMLLISIFIIWYLGLLGPVLQHHYSHRPPTDNTGKIPAQHYKESLEREASEHKEQ